MEPPTTQATQKDGQLNETELKKILFITTSSLSTNPRLIKEMRSLQNVAEMTCLSFKIGGWSDKVDKQIIQSFPKVQFLQLSARRSPFPNWLESSLISLFCQKIWPFFKQTLWVSAFASFKRSWIIKKTLKKLENEPFDILIGHNLGALYPIHLYSKKTATPFGFDVEDYHPGERIERDAKNEKARRIFLMRRLLPKAAYVTYASPLIKKETLELLGHQDQIEKQVVVNNAFPKEEFSFIPPSNKKTTFVWFSQNISAHRGLELVLPALQAYSDRVILRLIGKLDLSFFDAILKPYSSFLKIEPPVSQKCLHRLVSECDVGLALELNTADYNRQICLTNKIYAYAQSGIYILATNTSAQSEFLSKHGKFGTIANPTMKDIENAILSILEEIETIRQNKIERFECAREMAWETEANKFHQLLEEF